MHKQFRKRLESKPIEASAPCRIDMGGTLDIATFYYPLRHLEPCTFNIAIGLRTHVRVEPYEPGMVKVSSRGFESAMFPLIKAPFDHPLGLMFATASYFNADGIHIVINSTSPPRSALGGSSAAAIALVAALLKATASAVGGKTYTKPQTVLLTHGIEESVAGVPCGFQDHLAAIYGGVNAWYWTGNISRSLFRKKAVVPKSRHKQLENHLLLAYCGRPHKSKNINGKWVREFLAGKHRQHWSEIIACTQQFVEKLSLGNLNTAVSLMNCETAIRRKMTPDVLDNIGEKLVERAIEHKCGARFTGAGGGGCIWALGEPDRIEKLKEAWEGILATTTEGALLDVTIDSDGLLVSS
jgi:D-glycero-alpha-D-manno-heptose-7-phosphate kinase